MIEALSFLGPHGPVTRDEHSRVFITTLCMLLVCLGTIQARAHVQLALACQQSTSISVPSVGCGSPCSTCMVMVEFGVTNVLIMLLHLAHSDSSLATTLPHAGFIITLTLLCVLMAVTTSARSWNDCSTFEQMQHPFLKIGVSVGFSHRVHCASCAFHVTETRVSLALSLFPQGSCFLKQVMDRLSSSASTE